VPALGGHLGGPRLGAPVAGLIVQAAQVDPLVGAPTAGPLLWVIWVDRALALGVRLYNFCHFTVDVDGECLHASCLLLVLRPPMAFSSCFLLGCRGHSHRACGPLIPCAVPKDPKGGVDVEGGRGHHRIFYLNWLGCFFGKNVMSRITYCLQKYEGKIGYGTISTVPYLKTFLVFR
jgi:hypothetical protein